MPSPAPPLRHCGARRECLCQQGRRGYGDTDGSGGIAMLWLGPDEEGSDAADKHPRVLNPGKAVTAIGLVTVLLWQTTGEKARRPTGSCPGVLGGFHRTVAAGCTGGVCFPGGTVMAGQRTGFVTPGRLPRRVETRSAACSTASRRID